jgi:uncharacterized repeat protein (TIGR01451 family)
MMRGVLGTERLLNARNFQSLAAFNFWFLPSMRFFYILRIIAVLVAGLIVAGERAEAQSFGLGVTSSASSILVSNALTYTINVTNLSGSLQPEAAVSNVFSGPFQLLNATNSLGSFTNYGSVVVFDLFVFSTAQITLTIQPTAIGFFTNAITAATTNAALVIIPASTNIVAQVTNVVPVQSDLGVALTGFAQQTNIVGDLMTYGLTATNLGPDDASAVQLTNTLPAGVILKSISPANQPHSVVTNNLIFDLGTLTAGGGTNLQFTIQPTNPGVLNFSASIGTSGIVDPNPTNNTASTNIYVINYLPDQLTVSLVSTQKYNPQNGLVEQTILVSNVGTNAVLAARVVVSGLTNRLFNASGTNNGNPFVVYVSTLETNQSVNLLLQFLAASYFPLPVSQLQAFGVPVPTLTPPTAVSTSASLNISRLVPLANGDMLVEFPTTAGRAYTVVYSDNVAFSNAAIAPPAIVATANRLQWIDYGPPTTVSLPVNATNRFYRVFLNP